MTDKTKLTGKRVSFSINEMEFLFDSIEDAQVAQVAMSKAVVVDWVSRKDIQMEHFLDGTPYTHLATEYGVDHIYIDEKSACDALDILEKDIELTKQASENQEVSR